jgi:hypothetical protein
MEGTIYQRRGDILEADIGDELVALNVDDGMCFGFNSVATDVWKMLEQPQSASQLRARLAEQYEVDPERCAAELNSLLDQFVDMGLVALTRQAAPAGNRVES